MRALIVLAALAFPPLAHAQDNACLASFASRYLGETEKPLERTLSPAEHRDIVLSFDEADALFGDHPNDQHEHAGQRFANREVSALLLRIHQLTSIQTLTTHQRRTIVSGFSRYDGEGVVLMQTETGARVIEFTRADRPTALSYARASLDACPPPRVRRRRS